MALDRLIVHWRKGGLRWLLLDEFESAVREDIGELSDLESFVDSFGIPGDVVLLLSGEQVLLKTIEVPPKPTKAILDAVPYLVEESLACDVFDCFIAIGQRRGNALDVGVVDKTQLTDCLAALSHIGLDPQFVGVDLEVVGAEDNVMLLDEESALVALTDGTRFALPAQHLPQQLPVLLRGLMERLPVNFFGDGPPEQVLPTETMSMLDLEARSHPTLLTYLAAQALDGRINFRQGEFARVDANKTAQGWFKRLGFAAGLVLAVTMLSVGSQGIYLASQSSELEAEARALYTAIYPNDRNPRDLNRRWRSRLNDSGQGTGLSAGQWLNAISRPISQSGLQLDNLNYNAGRGDLVLQLSGQRSDQIMSLAKTFGELGYAAEIGTISQERNQVRGSLRMQLEPSL